MEERGKIKGKPALTVGKCVTAEASSTFRSAAAQRVIRRDTKIGEKRGNEKERRGEQGQA